MTSRTALLALSLAFAAGCDEVDDPDLRVRWSRVTAEPDLRGKRQAPEPRYVIIVIGDGMQLAHEISGSRYWYGRDDKLSFHDFPTHLYKTTWDVSVYNARASRVGALPYAPDTFDPMIGYDIEVGGEAPYPILSDNPTRREYFLSGIYPDSASTATAMSTGIKTDSSNIAWFSGDPVNGALATSPQLLRRRYGMSIGLVTTVPFSHATPAGFFSHNTERSAYYDIAREILLVTKPDVVIGGGVAASSHVNPADVAQALASGEWVHVNRQAGIDGGDSLREGAALARAQNKRLLGTFGDAAGNFESPVPSHAPGKPSVRRGSIENPTLADAALAAIDVLSANPNGFFLLLEQGDIDWANHANDFPRMIGCVTDLDRGVKAILDYVDRPDDAMDWSNTTLIVTADHANSYMRFARTLGPGELAQIQPDTGTYSPSDISYGTGSHTAELISLYAKGLAAPSLERAATNYPDHPLIVDDTAIFGMTLDAAAR
jgi:alkaline phosphatase